MSATQNTAATNLVVGLGATGLSIARYLKRHDERAIFYDSREKPPGCEDLEAIYPGAEVRHADDDIPDGTERLIVSPGVPDCHPLLEKARGEDIEVVSDIELFARAADKPFLAVTGSNGKSTVTTLLWQMCCADGRAALAGGNLGEPALDLLEHDETDIYVLELSSFQLQRTHTLPAEVAVLLNVTPDHLDWHRDEAEYRAAKYRIFDDADAAVINRTDEEAARRTSHCGRVVSFGLDEPEEDHYGIREEQGRKYLACGEALLLAIRDLALYGVHNQLNALAALAAGDLIGLERAAMLQVLVEFPGLPHRMQFVARIGAVDYINDSKATNVAAAVASIDSVDGMLVLIAGGEGKGGDFSGLATAVEGKLRGAVLIGQDADKIARALDTVMPVHFAENMESAVHLAAGCAESDDTVLLAPACASFDQYDNYMARGDAFVAAVEGLQT
ncbi:MAG: UDP-N-acetylmuramoyl-L-alanine--D-glutamate ligase [Gammaproteobacteria bacterium]|nr:UDP-N-acetylmuramoyl-L-alanine--D-glutamate ligase [Gammaproteobacteria bacterium]NNF49509.1 UDP-N-acetylmuramoyl-L-alanine--D-glutamate ligase [Woeseiaceae bacterium]MBT8094211.1 UDP-N-acetylmuramoyl-L-alanine--D-glutamate ligase [Gammaproteobacteria bacterium]MBT8104576.1 UDP-N-acetylmuramoyl-L-alanine--D-glutamate ligase [Gammaproteobacteria bacterium]NNK24590.1 UDP-N-acetylmuramoyl-L-alanine--D-glutamate ligase [Woeseiaceae bacterium]